MSFGATGKITKVSLVQAGAGVLAIAPGVAGSVLRLIGLYGSLTANGTIQLQSISAGSVVTNKSGAINGLSGAYFQAPPFEEGYVSSNTGEALQMTTTGAGFNGFAIVQQCLP